MNQSTRDYCISTICAFIRERYSDPSMATRQPDMGDTLQELCLVLDKAFKPASLEERVARLEKALGQR